MKYSDCPTISASVTINASAEAIWELVSDIHLPARHSNELQSVRWLNGATEGSVGAQFEGQNGNPVVGEWNTTCIVTQWEPNRVFEWAVEDVDHPVAKWRFTITPSESGSGSDADSGSDAGTDGGTMLEQWFQIGPAPSGLTPAIAARPDKEERILQHRLDSQKVNMQANLDAIKSEVEA